MADEVAAPVPVDEPPKRGRGKPKGLPKSGGRKKGSPASKVREELEALFAANAKPLAKFLFAVSLGHQVRVPDPADAKKVVKRMLGPELRIQAAKTLLAKGWPDLKATEMSGPGGEPINRIERVIITIVDPQDRASTLHSDHTGVAAAREMATRAETEAREAAALKRALDSEELRWGEAAAENKAPKPGEPGYRAWLTAYTRGQQRPHALVEKLEMERTTQNG